MIWGIKSVIQSSGFQPLNRLLWWNKPPDTQQWWQNFFSGSLIPSEAIRSKRMPQQTPYSLPVWSEWHLLSSKRWSTAIRWHKPAIRQWLQISAHLLKTANFSAEKQWFPSPQWSTRWHQKKSSFRCQPPRSLQLWWKVHKMLLKKQALKMIKI